MDTFLDHPKQDDNLPFTTSDDRITFTLVTPGGHTLLPYHSLTEARLTNEGRELTLYTMDYLITITGKGLRPLWKELQNFNVQEVSMLNSSEDHETHIADITITPRDP